MKKRQALVIGINEYPSGDNLSTAAQDAERIAQLLEQYGGFEVYRLPIYQDEREVSKDLFVTLPELKTAITQLFQPQSSIIPETALLFFAGHGWRREEDGQTEGFLVTSCNDDNCSESGLFSLKELHQILKDSPVRQQIVWLDCCHSGELFNFLEQDLDEFEQQRNIDRCFVSACREFQPAYGRVLTPALLEALSPTNKEKDRVTNLTLKPLLEAALQNARQHSVIRNTGSQIILTHKGGVRGNICPYKGLYYFDFNPTKPEEAEDHKYFYGRIDLINQLLGKVASGNFLAVIGASGSGKSSVVRAGLLHQLYLGNLGNQSPLKNKIPGSDRWTFYPPFTPGTDPLGNLQQVLGINVKTADDLVNFIERTPSERVVLVVDQFEEVFAPPNKDKRQDFFECLMGSVERLGNKLCLVLVMRDDFKHKCEEQDYAGLANKIDNNLVEVQRMNSQELQEVIHQPARSVELEIDGDLVEQMIADVSDSPGDLALLQYTLTQLWENSSFNLLTISDYIRLGGVQKALGNHADTVYNSLLPEEQKAARRIFLELTRLSEDENTPNTRQQVWLKDLVNSQQSEELVNNVVNCLADAKLVVTSEEELEGQRVAVVNVVHETLIRHWGLLGGWLKDSREALIIKQQIEDAAKEWRDRGKLKDSAYLLQGTRLAVAKGYIQRHDNSFPLSLLAQEFVHKSIKSRRKTFLIRSGLGASAIAGLIGFTVYIWIQSVNAQLRAFSTNSTGNISSGLELEALIKNIDAGKQLKKLEQSGRAEAETRMLVLTNLHQLVYGIRERNRLKVENSVNSISFSPDGQIIASGDLSGTVKLWKPDGSLINTLIQHGANVEDVSFSPDGQIIASASRDKTVKLWKRDGSLIAILTSHIAEVSSVSFSPDGKTIASASWDKTVKLWTRDGNLMKTLPGHSDGVLSVSFSPDGKTLASASSDKTIKLWKRNGSLIKTLRGHKDRVSSVSFSPNGQMIVSASWDKTVKLWKRDGSLFKTLEGHTGDVEDVRFSPDGQMIASASKDKTVKLWKRNGSLFKTLNGNIYPFNSVSFSPDGKTLAAGENQLWKLDGNEIKTLSGHTDGVEAVSFSPNGQMIASASKDKTIKLWKRDGSLIKTLIEPSNKSPSSDCSGDEPSSSSPDSSNTVSSVSFSPDGKTLASVHEDGTVKLWNQDGSLINTFTGHGCWVADVSFSQNGQMIASASRDKTVKLWNQDGSLINTLKGHNGAVTSVSFSPDGQMIASASREDGTIKLWRLDGSLITSFRAGSTSISFSANGQTIASANLDGTVKLWKLDGSLINTLTGHKNKVTNVIFSPDGQIIASASEDSTVKLWKPDGSLINTLKGHKDHVKSLSFSPDSKTLASASRDKTVILWNLNLDDLLVRGCNWVRPYLQNNPNVSESDKHLCDGI